MFLPVSLELLVGFWETVKIFVLTLVFALPLGLVIAFGSMSRWAPFHRVGIAKLNFLKGWMPIRWLTRGFVWIIRGIPLMLQIFIIYYVPGLLFKDQIPLFSRLDRFFFLNYGVKDAGRIIAVLIAFTINYACYFSEIYRGGIESISKGQYEAGYVLGLTKGQVFRHIVLKQVVQRIVPPMSNEIITLIKDTALANCIVVCEIIKQANELAATKALVWPLFYTGAFYLIFVGFLTISLIRYSR